MADDLDEKFKQDIAGRLRTLCRAIEVTQGKTQADVGRLAGVPDSGTWSLYLSGDRKVPYRVLWGCWNAFGADTAWFIGGVTRNNTEAFNAALLALDKGASTAKPRRGRPPTPRS